MGGGGKIMAGCGWSWVVGMKLWMVIGGGSKIMAGRGWWQQNCGWLGVVVGGRGWSHNLVMPLLNSAMLALFLALMNFFSKFNITV